LYIEVLTSGNLFAFEKEYCILDGELLRGELRIWAGVEEIIDIK